MVWKVSPNYLSQTLSSPNASDDANVTLLPKRELFFEHVHLHIYSVKMPFSITN